VTNISYKINFHPITGYQLIWHTHILPFVIQTISYMHKYIQCLNYAVYKLHCFM